MALGSQEAGGRFGFLLSLHPDLCFSFLSFGFFLTFANGMVCTCVRAKKSPSQP